MQTTYDGSNSIIFDGIDSWEAWGLIPASRPSVSLPSVRTNTLEIPGMNGVLDLSETPIGYPTYGNRSGSWTFNVAHDVIDTPWDILYTKIAGALHGRKVRCILKEDKSWFYEGRLTVGDWQSDKVFSKISISYDLAPYKRLIWTTTEDWLWDPFDFISGVIHKPEFKDIAITSGTEKVIEYTQDFIGMAPVCPTFYVTLTSGSYLTLNVKNDGVKNEFKQYTLSAGRTSNPLIEFVCPTPASKTILKITGAGTISIDFRPGRL